MIQHIYRPILFRAGMVRAIISGRKTQTRRIVKGPALEHIFGPAFTPEIFHNSPLCPYGLPGDRLWVRETWRPKSHKFPTGCKYEYRATDREFVPDDLPWRPSIFMPKSASRLHLEVVAVRIERLKDITEYDAEQEGFCSDMLNTGFSAVNWFSELWDDINGEGAFDSNPWVWVIEFKQISMQ